MPCLESTDSPPTDFIENLSSWEKCWELQGLSFWKDTLQLDTHPHYTGVKKNTTDAPKQSSKEWISVNMSELSISDFLSRSVSACWHVHAGVR